MILFSKTFSVLCLFKILIGISGSLLVIYTGGIVYVYILITSYGVDCSMSIELAESILHTAKKEDNVLIQDLGSASAKTAIIEYLRYQC